MAKLHSFVLEIFFLLVLPVALLLWSSQALAFRHIFMGVGGLYCGWRLWSGRATLSDLGIRSRGLTISLRRLAIPSLIMVAITYLLFIALPTSSLRAFVGYDPLTISSFTTRILAYIFLSSPVQELIFRGYLTWRLRQVFAHKPTIMIISSLLFTFAHLPFYSPLLLLVSAAMGIIYIQIYLKEKNLLAPIISHSLVGAAMIIARNAWFPY